ncbi:hypothetical protein Rhe02_02950 [Rhizocola hellebori]|uniref:Uncharacterized protein n=1 Tax=Rhizocola hellebori TaxID=1392758 RepID=A0A8J3Q2G4_9ACTN|nr:hypothetical protein [Rhizocola hellebori]GIH02228.1 hypothetical protein Rhe02_02950 [Rhizocola hellebori]
MLGIGIFITGPAENTVVGRRQQFTGSIAAFNGSVSSVTIQFGSGGETINVTPANRNARNGLGWSWTGLIPNSIRPGQSFQLIAVVDGTMNTSPPNDPEPNIEPAHGERRATYTLENVVPSIAMTPFQSPISTLAAGYTTTFTGTFDEANPGGVYGTPLVRYQIDNGPLLNATTAGKTWSVTATFAPGQHTFTVQASDPFNSVTSIQRPLQVYRYPAPGTTDPNVTKTRAGLPTTSSVTTWTRLEPQIANADIATSTGARVLDPLWLLTRQWQLGEFQAEDTGSPVKARFRATTAPLTRSRPGHLNTGTNAGTPYDPARTPLEAIIERRRMRPTNVDDTRMLTAAVDAGLHFLRMLELDPAGAKYRAVFRTRYPVPDTQTDDAATTRFLQAMAGRAVDARQLVPAFAMQPIVFDPTLRIAAADVPALQRVAAGWLSWYSALFSEPTGPGDDAWDPARLEYSASVAARLADEPITLSAAEFNGGRLDWSSFDVNRKSNLDTTGDQGTTTLSKVMLPAPIVVRGAPAPRFWEVEDAKVAYGLLPTGPTDLAHLMLIEYASTYGNDWYVVPLQLPVGTLTRVDSLVVTDTFGVKNLLRPIGDPTLPAPHFSMWQLSDLRAPGERLGVLRDATRPLDPRVGSPVPNRFFLAPAIGRSLDGSTLEDVLFMRDEMANVAWAIEQSVESPVELAVARDNGVAPPPVAGELARYLLASSVADNWIPLLPVQLPAGQDHPAQSRLRVGQVLQPDGTGKTHPAIGQILPADTGFLLYDEEIPREGVRVTRSRRMARWSDGSTWIWAALRKQAGRGEGNSALAFDQLIEP